MANPSPQTPRDLIPWGWNITPNVPNYNCPSPSSILGTFGIVSVLVSSLNLITGHRKVINFVSFGLFGKELGDSWRFMFLVPLITQLGANAFIAYLYQHTTGFGQGFTIIDLMLFYTTRPRMGWLVLTCVIGWGIREENTRGGQKLKGFYENSAKGAILAEIILMIIASFYYGRTMHFAVTRGYYLRGHLTGPSAHDAHIMYVGALLYTVFLYTPLFYLVLLVIDEKFGFLDDPLASVLLAVGVTGTTTWLGSWLFWAGYVHLAQDLYCPPKLLESGAVWTTVSIIGTFFGGGF